MVRTTQVSANYFSALHVSLLQGRFWSADEAHQRLPYAVVNESFVRRFSQGRSVLNRTVRLPGLTLDALHANGLMISPAITRPELQIIGVVADTVNDGLDKPVVPNVFLNADGLLRGGNLYFVQTAGDPAMYRRAVAQAARSATGKAYVFALPYTLREMVEHDPVWRTQRLVAVLLAIFAAFALALSLVGLYSVVSYVVARRTSEFGIRIALGAQRGQILGLVMRSNLAVILGGTAAGVLASLLIRARLRSGRSTVRGAPC